MVKEYTLILENGLPTLSMVKDYHENLNIKCDRDIIYFMIRHYHLNIMAEEYAYVIALATDGACLGIFQISHGTVNASLVSPREIFIRCLLIGATNIIFIHNHPSGNPKESLEDRNITKKLKDAGLIIGIKLIDSIIIGRENENHINI